MTDMKSVFTMASGDLDTKIAELGEFFTIRASDASSKPILLQQRLDEIHYKGTERPITQTFYREFGGVPITWQPLYAPIDTETYPYGTRLISADILDSVGDAYGELFLTSRGMVSIPLNDLAGLVTRNGGYASPAEITAQALVKFNQVVKPLLPLHIVFDGMQVYTQITVKDRIDRGRLVSITSTTATIHADAIEREKPKLMPIRIETGKMVSTPAPTTIQKYRFYDETMLDGAILDTDTWPESD